MERFGHIFAGKSRQVMCLTLLSAFSVLSGVGLGGKAYAQGPVTFVFVAQCVDYAEQGCAAFELRPGDLIVGQLTLDRSLVSLTGNFTLPRNSSLHNFQFQIGNRTFTKAEIIMDISGAFGTFGSGYDGTNPQAVDIPYGLYLAEVSLALGSPSGSALIIQNGELKTTTHGGSAQAVSHFVNVRDNFHLAPPRSSAPHTPRAGSRELADLQSLIRRLNFPTELETSLQRVVEAAVAALEAGDEALACGQLSSFSLILQRDAGGLLKITQLHLLATAARRAASALGCD